MTTTRPAQLPAGAPDLASLMSPDMMSAALGVLPQLIALAQRVPAWILGFVLGFVWWLVVVPLAVAVVDFADPLAVVRSAGWSTRASDAPPAAALFGAAATDGDAASADWDSAEQAARPDDDDEEEADGRERRGGERRPAAQAVPPPTLLACVRARGGFAALRCLRETGDALPTMFVAMITLAAAASGAATWWQGFSEQRAQHARAMDIAEDAAQMQRQASLD
jgi:hypothetical protein